jgi:hypothetical protein
LATHAREYWLNQAERASERGDHGQAYQHFYAAGWDFFFSNDMGTILSSLMMVRPKKPDLARLWRFHAPRVAHLLI